MAGTYAKYVGNDFTFSTGSGITSINGNTAAAQFIVGGTGISVSSGGGTTTITNTEPGGDAFTIIQTDTGTFPTATSPTSTLTLHNSDSNVSIAGNSSTNTVTLNLSAAFLSSFVTNVTASSPLASSGGQTPNITITQANSTTNGYLSSTDWNTFNNKQPSGNYITALTGDVTATGPGSAATTLATVNSNTGTFLYPQITVNGKGLVTAASTPTQSANTVFAGPSSGAVATPTFRALVLSDLPAGGQQFITSGTTYTTPANINTSTRFKFTLIGGGGGSPGINTPNGRGGGAGGGGGGIVYVTGLSPSTAYTIAIGAGGTAGTAAPTTGGTGGTTSITIGATTYSATGGGSTTAGADQVGGLGGGTANCTIGINGGSGDGSPNAAAGAGVSGRGGDSPFGFGIGGAATGSNLFFGNALAGVGYGAGAGGTSETTTAAAGAVGTQGCIFAEWGV